MDTMPNKAALGCLLAASLALRIWVATFQPNIIWPDEIFQVVEPAHRLVYGNGIVAWEYVLGMRSWIFPGAVAGLLWLGTLFGSDPAFKQVPVQAFMLLASLVPVTVGYRWGERLDGLRGGLVVGGFLAVWVDLLYMASHPLSDVIAADLLIAALYAALPLTDKPGARRLMLAGALSGLTFVLRFQLGPALFVAAIFACRRDNCAWRALLTGGGMVVLASGALDWLTLGTPFQSIWLNLWLNIVKGISSDYGTAPAAYFIIAPKFYWGPMVAILVFAQAVIGGRRFPALFAVALTILLTQSAIAHKEWRFIFPVVPLLVTLSGIAVLSEMHDFAGRHSTRRGIFAAGALLIWTSASAAAALTPSYRQHWTSRSELVKAFALASRQPGICALSLVDLEWIDTPGSAALPAGVPIYSDLPPNARHNLSAYNVAIGTEKASLPGYRRVACFQGSANLKGQLQKTACVWTRGGSCAADGAKLPPVNWPLYFADPRGLGRPDRIAPYLRLRD
jgi:phosphatidylinositol glycan class B